MRVRRVKDVLYTVTNYPDTSQVATIIEEVRRFGDDAVISWTERFDHAELGPGGLRVDLNELESSVGILERDVLSGLHTAIANVKAVAKAQVRDDPVTVELPEGHAVEVVERPVRRAAGRRTRPRS